MMDEKLDNIEKLADNICKLSIIEVSELANLLKERLNIPDMPVGGMNNLATEGCVAKGVEEGSIEKEDYSLFLQSFGEKKTQVIKVVREIKKKEGAEIGLKDAKDMVESAPVEICNNIPKNKAEDYSKLLKDVGAEVKVE